MPLVVWGLDEVFEAIGGVYFVIVGIFVLLVLLEHGLTAEAPTRRPARHRRSSAEGRETEAVRRPERR